MKFIFKTLLLLVYYLSFFIHRNKRKWCFANSTGFSGNAKYLLFQINNFNNYNLTCIWIANNLESRNEVRALGLKSYQKNSIMGIYHMITSKVFIVNINSNDVNPYLTGGAYLVNLWHGVTLKACGWARTWKYGKHIIKKGFNDNSIYSKIIAFGLLFRKPNLCLSTSPFMTKEINSKIFNVENDRFIEAKYPRNMLFSKNKSEIIEHVKKYENTTVLSFIEELKNYSKIYIYMPTFRDDGQDFIKSSGFWFSKLNSILVEKNHLFIFKLHPLTKIDYSIINTFSNFIVLDSKIDIYPILPFTDVLITDYSSIYYDYVLLNKEIILFIFDKDNYIKSNRDLLLDFDTYTSAIKANNFNQLCDYIKYDKDCSVKNIDFIISTFWKSMDNNIDLIKYIYTKSNDFRE